MLSNNDLRQYTNKVLLFDIIVLVLFTSKKLILDKYSCYMRKSSSSHAIFMIIILLLSSLTIFAQKRTLTGVVSDQKGTPLASATVTVKGEKIATITDANGTFRIDVSSPTAILVISYVGSKPIEVSTTGKTTVLVTLNVTDTNLSEVVVLAMELKKGGM